MMKKEIDWLTGTLLAFTHLIGIVGTAVYSYYNAFHPFDISLFLILYFTTGLSITAGYHRYYSHRSYECHRVVRAFFLSIVACALENSVLRWSADHRMHQQNV